MSESRLIQPADLATGLWSTADAVRGAACWNAFQDVPHVPAEAGAVFRLLSAATWFVKQLNSAGEAAARGTVTLDRIEAVAAGLDKLHTAVAEFGEPPADVIGPPPRRRSAWEVQRAHDILWSQHMGETPWVLDDEAAGRPLLAAGLDVLCWVLRHDHADGFARSLAAVEAGLAERGYTLGPVTGPGGPPPPGRP